MASTYVNDLRLNEMATGDGSGTWGTTTNTNLELIAEAMGYGTEAVADASTDTITMADGATDGFRCTFLRLTGGGQACTVTLAPNTLSHTWIIRNTTSYALTFTQGSGANVIIAAGQAKIVTTDGLGAGAVVYEGLEDLELGGTLGVTGVVTANAGVVVDNITIDGTEIDLSSGDLTVDVAGDIFLDADGGTIRFKDGGTTIADISNSSSDLQIEAKVQDKDIKFLGDDGGSGITALTLDMSEAGAATFNDKVIATELDISGDADIDGTTNLDAVDVDGAVNFAADVTFADGADIITASAGTSNFRAGVNAGNSIQSGGNYNVCVGDEAGTALTTGDSNTAAGYQALKACTTTGNNVAIGKNALLVCTTGASNTAVGSSALAAHTDANNCTAIGADSLQTNTTGTGNTAVGQGALNANSTGALNTAVGYGALNANDTAANNVAVGASALAANTTGTNNVAMGANALDANTTASNNTAIGDNALGVNVDGASNTALGSAALAAMVDANYSTAIGADTLQNATGGGNTACGQGALNGVVAGIYNTGLGYSAGNAITSGDNNLCLGRDAGIASSPGGAVTTGDNQICLGDENITHAHIQVDWTVASDGRDKTDISELNSGLSFVNQLKPVTYRWDKRSNYSKDQDITPDGQYKSEQLDVGFLAQDVSELEKDYGFSNEEKSNLISSISSDGKMYGLKYNKFVPMLVNAVQELSAEVEALKSKLEDK